MTANPAFATKDIAINFSGKTPVLAIEWGDGIINMIYLSLSVNKGSYFFNLEFGSDLYTIDKVTDATVDLARQYAEAALRSLVERRRIMDLVVTAIRNDTAAGIDLSVSARRSDGTPVSLKFFRQVR